MTFLDIAPTRRDHTVLIPKLHGRGRMADDADAALAAMATDLHVVGRALLSGLNADGLRVFQSNGEASGQKVFHLHVHLVPRHRGDGRLTVWERDDVEAKRLAETHAVIQHSVR